MGFIVKGLCEECSHHGQSTVCGRWQGLQPQEHSEVPVPVVIETIDRCDRIAWYRAGVSVLAAHRDFSMGGRNWMG